MDTHIPDGSVCDEETASLIQEVARMQKEITQLKQQIVTLQAENERLTREVDLTESDNLAEATHGPDSDKSSGSDDGETHVDEDGAIKQAGVIEEEGQLVKGGHGAQTARFTPNLPPEIWYSIFQRTIPPSWLLDPSLSLGPNSSWSAALRLKKSIVAVSRSWYDISLPFLYEDICIRRVHQFKTLHETISRSLMKFGPLVKTLNVLCFVPEVFQDHFTKYLEAFFALFPRLSTFASTSFMVLPIEASIPMLPPSITHLRIDNLSSYKPLINSLEQIHTNLISLWLRLPSLDSVPVIDRNVSLPRLVSLILEHNQAGERGGVGFTFLTRHFDFPCLSKCTIYQTSELPRTNDGLANALVAFLSKHGSNLKFFGLHHTMLRLLPVAFSSKLHQLRQYCPHLERFNMPISILTSNATWMDSFAHPTLRWIDFSHPPVLNERDDLPNIRLLRCNLPALQGFRVLSDLPQVSHGWLQDFPPDSERTPTRRFAIDFSPSLLVHGVDYVYWQRPQWSAAGWHCEDDFSSVFRDLDWPDMRCERRDNALVVSMDGPKNGRDDQSDSSDESYVSETDSSECSDGSYSDLEEEERILRDHNAEMDLASALSVAMEVDTA